MLRSCFDMFEMLFEAKIFQTNQNLNDAKVVIKAKNAAVMVNNACGWRIIY